jgi:hypothetical protein
MEHIYWMNFFRFRFLMFLSAPLRVPICPRQNQARHRASQYHWLPSDSKKSMSITAGHLFSRLTSTSRKIIGEVVKHLILLKKNPALKHHQ